MGRYLTDAQIAQICNELSVLYALPFANDLAGTAFEAILAEVKGGQWTQMRDNRPRPDVIVMEGGQQVNYSVKIEGLRCTRARACASNFLGHHEDLIVARPKVDGLLDAGQTIANLSPDELGAKVLQYYNEQIVRRYHWDVLAILLRVHGTNEFIYWEERPPAVYVPADYWWQESGKATGGNRNINGYPVSVNRKPPLPRAKFKWTSGGKQFYVLYEIPRDADIWQVQPVRLTSGEVRRMIAAALEERARYSVSPDAVVPDPPPPEKPEDQ